MPSTILSDNGASSGSAGIKTTGGNDGVLILQTTTSGGTATNAVYIDTSQNVGVGTTSPFSKLDVRSTNAGAEVYGGIFANDSTSASSRVSLSFVTGSDGTAGRIRSQVVGDSDGSNNGYLAFYTRNGGTNSERARIDSSGKLLVGATSSIGSCIAQFTDAGGQSALFNTPSASGAYVGWFNNGTGNGYIGAAAQLVGSGAAGDFCIRAQDKLVFASGGGTEAARINSSGNFLMGTTTTVGSGAARFSVSGAGGVVCGFQSTGGTGNECTFNWNTATTGNNLFTSFYTEGTATGRGSIDYNRGAGLTRYNTTSDATLKNIIGDADGAKSVEILSSTRIREYSWKEDQANKPQIGVIAQELYETFSGAVSVGGDKVSVDEEGNETTQYVPWAVDKTAFTFHLVKGWQEHERIIQEQQAIITQLQADVAALKGTQP